MKTTRLFLTVLLISCSIILISQNTQMKYLPVSNGGVIDFNSDIEQIKQLPSHSYVMNEMYIGQTLNPLDETMLDYAYQEYTAYGDPTHTELFTYYRGQSPKFCQSIVHDADGNLLFFIIDNNIYNHEGKSFIDINALNFDGNPTGINYGYLTNISLYTISSTTQEFNHDINRFTDNWDIVINSDLIVVPVPNTCNQFYLIFTAAAVKTGALNHYTGINYRKLTYIDENTIELSNVIEIAYDGACRENEKTSLSITDYRSEQNEQNYLLYGMLYHYLFVYEVNEIGIFNNNGLTDIFYDLGFRSELKTGEYFPEMETYLYENSGNPYYLISIPIHDGPYMRLIKFPYSFSQYQSFGNLATNIAPETLQYNTPLEQTVFLQINDASSIEFIKGIEFSPDGKYLYLTHTNQTNLKYLNIEDIINDIFNNTNYTDTYIDKLGLQIYLNSIAIPNAYDYGYSEIETGNDNNLYLINAEVSGDFNNYVSGIGLGKISYLSNPNSPSITNWVANPSFNNTIGINISTNFSATIGMRESYIFSNNIDRSDYVYYNHYIGNNCCYDFSVDIPTFTSDGSTDIWSPDNNPFGSFNTTATFDGNLIIPNNKRLVINDLTIKFTEGHGIIMQSDPATMGSRLILDNTTLTSSCGVMWNGIEMTGISNESQFPITTSKQPMVEIRNSSVIENALTGINAFSGSIAILKNSTFRNNENGVFYGSFYGNLNQYLYRNASYIRNCSFITDNTLNNPLKYPLSFISFAGISGLPITGCDFANTTPIDYNPSEINKRGYGIYSNGSNLDVKPHCNTLIPSGTECPDNQKDRNTFTGLNYGIQANVMLGSSSVSVKENIFTNNRMGIAINGEHNYGEIYKNEFTVGDLGLACGLYINGSNIFNIEENKFKDGEVGMIVNNSEDNSNTIYNNIFDNISNILNAAAFLALNDNADQSGSSGLKVKCNDFTDNSYNITVIDGFIKQQQGSDGSPTAPAGNTFDVSTNCTDNNSGFYVQGASPYNYDYYFHSFGDATDMDGCKSSSVIIIPTDQTFYKEEACPLTNHLIILPVLNKINLLNELKNAIDISENELDSLIDGGNTVIMLNLLANIAPNNFNQTCNILMGASPYLSDTVLSGFMDIGMNGHQTTKRDILLANSPLPENAGNKLADYWLPPPMKNEVLNVQNGINPVDNKKQELNNLVNEREKILNDIVLQCLKNDSVPEMKDTLMMVLSNETGYKVKYKYIPFLISQDEITLAIQELNDFELYANTLETDLRNETLDYIHLQRIIIAIKMAPSGEFYRTVFRNQDFLLVLAESEKSRGTITAQNLLMHAGLSNYTEKIVLPFQGTPKSMQLENNQSDDSNNAFDQNYLFSVYPNPANTNIIVEYPVFENDAIGNEINIYNIKGQLVLSQPIEKQTGYISIDVSKLTTGNYIVCIGDIHKTKYKKQLNIKH
ncbi:MAG: T9SS type A sorting domain-containing protein [Bacteroidota bacterium]